MQKFRNEEEEIYNQKFYAWLTNMNDNYLNWFDKEFLNQFNINRSANFQRSKNTKKGFSEDNFFLKLYQEFKNEIKVDTVLDHYYPDITIAINNTLIDIEIDEPYTYDEKKEIHYINDKGQHIDTERDKFFLQKNWFVLRFSEEQTVKYADECVQIVSLIAQFIKTADVDVFVEYFNLLEKIQQPQWTYEDAKYMALTNARSNYNAK